MAPDDGATKHDAAESADATPPFDAGPLPPGVDAVLNLPPVGQVAKSPVLLFQHSGPALSTAQDPSNPPGSYSYTHPCPASLLSYSENFMVIEVRNTTSQTALVDLEAIAGYSAVLAVYAAPPTAATISSCVAAYNTKCSTLTACLFKSNGQAATFPAASSRYVMIQQNSSNQAGSLSVKTDGLF